MTEEARSNYAPLFFAFSTANTSKLKHCTGHSKPILTHLYYIHI